ncbi:MAG: glycerate kinase [bacterium]
MKKIILAPNSFKGSLSSQEACAVMKKAVLAADPDCQIVEMPVSDGGEGFADRFLGCYGGTKITVATSDARGRPLTSYYVCLPDGTAIVELALTAGLHLAGSHPDPATATTYGVGTVLCQAARAGAKKILIGLGGSATNDGGCGLASAIGVRFTNAAGAPFVPVGATLSQIAAIDVTGIDPAFANVEIRVACDVDNPLTGRTGAAQTFARQKGADPAMTDRLEAGLCAYASLLRYQYHFESEFPGAGAAGGTTVALKLFLNAVIERGIDVVLDAIGFNDALLDTDAVFTGEGRLDSQSFGGKALAGILARAGRQGIPVVAFAGRLDGLSMDHLPPVLTAIAITEAAIYLNDAIIGASKYLYDAVFRYCKYRFK